MAAATASLTPAQELAEEFSLMADGQYNLKHSLKRRKDGVDICFYAGGYVEFSEDRILAVIDTDQHLVWEIFPCDFDAALKRFTHFLKG